MSTMKTICCKCGEFLCETECNHHLAHQDSHGLCKACAVKSIFEWKFRRKLTYREMSFIMSHTEQLYKKYVEC